MSRNSGQGRSGKQQIPWLGVIILAGIVSNILEDLIGLTLSLVPLAIGAYIIVRVVRALSGRENKEKASEDAHRRDVEDYVRTHLNKQTGSSASYETGNTVRSPGTSDGTGQEEAYRNSGENGAQAAGTETRGAGASDYAAERGKMYAYRTASAGETGGKEAGSTVKGEYKGSCRSAGQGSYEQYGANTEFEDYINRKAERFERYVERHAERFERRAEKIEEKAARFEDKLNGKENKTGTYSAKDEKKAKKTKQQKSAGKDPGKKAKHLTRIFMFLGIFFLLGGVFEVTDKIAWASFATLLPDILLAVAGAIALIVGLAFRKRMLLNRKYAAVIGNREWMAIEQIASAASVSEKRCEKEIQALIDDGFFGNEAYIDISRGVFYRSSEVAAVHDENVRDTAAFREKNGTKEKAVGESLSEHEKIIREIRRLNDDIDDPDVSERIDRIEALTDNIYSLIEDHPEKRSQVATFMDYYLPTTLKLLSAYATFEDQAATGENIQQAKGNIESILDTLVEGFSQQLDKLFAADAMDISGDIRVLEQMMERDGLTRGKGNIHAYEAKEKSTGKGERMEGDSGNNGTSTAACSGAAAMQTMPEEDKIELKL